MPSRRGPLTDQLGVVSFGLGTRNASNISAVNQAAKGDAMTTVALEDLVVEVSNELGVGIHEAETIVERIVSTDDFVGIGE
jgi:hypothetical protein